MSLEADQEYARERYQKVKVTFPSKLLKKEDDIFTKTSAAKLTPLKKLAALYALMDQLAEHVHNFTPCKKGCSNCCHYAVSVSKIEIEYIEKHSSAKRNKAIGVKQNFHGQSCPFLKTGACSIYDARPYVCRRFHSLAPSSKWCLSDLSLDCEFPFMKFSEVEKAFQSILAESDSYDFVDIRQMFGLSKSKDN